MKHLVLRIGAVVALLGSLPAAHAQGTAEAQLAARPFTIVAPFPPGGPVDTLSRILATGLAERFRQPAVVDNRAGAGGNIGIELVKRAAPTGHTLLVVPAGNLTINPTLMPRLGYFGAPAVQAQLEHQGLNVWIVTARAFGDVIRKETATWAPVIKNRKIEAQ